MPETAIKQLEEALSNLKASEPRVHAYVSVHERAARKDAEAADAAPPTSPVNGWPFAVKEVFNVAGTVTSGGCRALGDNVPAGDATVVARLRAAGAVLVGTQVSHELTCGLDEPPTRNPWDLERYPGGSSAGAGVSVAVGSARFALGTDAAGSVRIPAAMTGTVGLKPTAGLISSAGVLRQATAPSIDHVGIIARTVEEVAQVLMVVAGPDSLDARTLHGLADPPLQQSLRQTGIEGKRLAILGEETLGALNQVYDLDRDIADAFETACAVFRDAGAKIVTLELPALAQAIEAVVAFFSAELAAAHRDLFADKKAAYHLDVAAMLEGAFEIPAASIDAAIQVRSTLRRDFSEALADAGAEFLLSPTTPRAAMPLSGFEPGTELGTLIPYTCGFNLIGNPAISVPCGFTREDLPIGLQIAGAHFADASVLGLAHVFQLRTQWHLRRPPLIGLEN